MCLYKRMPPKQQKEIKDEITREGIKVYKVVLVPAERSSSTAGRVRKMAYYSPYGKIVSNDRMYYLPYEDGVNIANEDITLNIMSNGTIVEGKKTYKSGFHFLKDREVAERLKTSFIGGDSWWEVEIIECTIKKSWITNIGYEKKPQDKKIATLGYTEEMVFVTKKAIFPNFRGKKND